MIRKQVDSSNIRSIGFDSEKSILEIEFLKGTVYQYLGVPENVYKMLTAASSHGTYFNANIKNANYQFIQVG